MVSVHADGAPLGAMVLPDVLRPVAAGCPESATKAWGSTAGFAPISPEKKLA